MYCGCVYVCRCACVVGGREIIMWQHSAVLIPLYLCLQSPPLNWEQMRVAGDDRPSDGRFNYRYSDRQDGETEKETGVKAVVVSGRTAELSFRAVLFILGELDLKWPSPAASQGVNGGLTWTGKEVRYLLYIWADKSFFSTFFLCLPQTDLITDCMH